MPPQTTNGASDTGSVAEKLRLDFFVLAGPIKRGWRSVVARWQRFRPKLTLRDLNDRELLDIGLTREEVEQLSPDRTVERIRTRAADLWSRGGM